MTVKQLRELLYKYDSDKEIVFRNKLVSGSARKLHLTEIADEVQGVHINLNLACQKPKAKESEEDK